MKKPLIILLILCLTVSAFGQQKPMLGVPIDPTHPLGDPVAAWFFLEGSGGQVFDLSGNGNTGTFQGTAPSWSSGKFGSAINLPGSDEYISLPSDKFQFFGDFSVVIHTKAGSIGQYDTLISQCNSSGRGWRLWTRDSSSYKYYFEADTANNTVSTSLISGEQQIVCVKDSVNLNIYINGIAEGTPQAIGSVVYVATQNTQIGGMATAGRWWPGRIDYCYIYNRALSASEVALLYRKPFCMFAEDDIALMAVEAPAPGGGQLIFIQSAIPLILLTLFCLGRRLGK